MMKTFKQYLTEIQNSTSWKQLLSKKPSENAFHEYYDTYSELEHQMFSDMINHKKQSFRLIKPEEIKRIYDEHKNLGFIKSEKLLDSIIQRCIKNTAQIRVNNIISGHEQDDPYEQYKNLYDEEDEHISEDEFNELAYNYVPFHGISDYGIKWAEDIVIRLIDAKNDNEKIVLLNHLFDVVHQRSDFAEYYVEGGKSTLAKISGTDYGVEE